MKISIIVPVYNVEKYLRKCIDSIINQSFRDIEIILVNDGSTDNSGTICDEYKKIDHRISVIHKKNGGLSSARNEGLKVSQGEYIGFIDSDDWIESDYYELLFNGIINNKADISVVQLTKVKDYDKIEFTTEAHKNWTVLDTSEAMKMLFSSNKIGYSAVNKLYKRELFSNTYYPEGMLMEDKATTYKLIHMSNLVAVNLSRKYHYYLRNNSIIRSAFNKKKFDSFIIHEELIKFVDNEYPDLHVLIRALYVKASIKMLIALIKSNHSDRRDYDRCIYVIKNYIKYALINMNFSILLKVLLVLIYFFPNVIYYLLKSKVLSYFFKQM